MSFRKQNNRKYNLVVSIPRSGRTFENFLNKFRSINKSSGKYIDRIVELVSRGKKYKSDSPTKASSYISEENESVRNSLSIFVDRKRPERPYRIGFLGSDFDIENLNIRVEGDEPHNCSSLVALGEADIAIAGWDEFLNVKQNALEDLTITKWGMYNYFLPKENKVRIAGSASLKRWNTTLQMEVQDFVGFFLIAKQKPVGSDKFKYPKDYLKHLKNHKNKIFVKGRYVDIVRQAYPYLNISPVHDVEDAIVNDSKGFLGLEIVQTGSTLINKNLVILGSPLFLSESLYVVDYYRYMENDFKNGVSKILEKLNPNGYFDEERIEQFAYWYFSLEKKMGENWINRPNVEDLFCTNDEIDKGLRPVRLKTRHWTPSDKYQLEEAKSMAIKAKIKLKTIYSSIKSSEKSK